MPGGLVAVGVALLAVASVTVYSAIRTVGQGELEALFVFGRMIAVLEPGLVIVPPFVSKTYPIDPQTMTIDRGHEQFEVPTAFEPAVRDGVGRTAASASPDEPVRSRESLWERGDQPSMPERIWTLLGIALFAAGAISLVVPVAMLGHLLPGDRWQVSWLFPEATVVDLAIAATVSFSLMLLGEYVATSYGTLRDDGIVA